MDKITKLQNYLTENNIVAAVLKMPENVMLFSGYWPRNGYSYIFIPAKGNPTVISPEGDWNDPELGFVKDIRKFGIIQIKDGNPYDNIQKIFKELFKEHNMPKDSIIGMDNGGESYSLPLCSGEVASIGETTIATVKKGFKAKQIVSVLDKIQEIKSIKNDYDLERLDAINELGIMTCNYFESIINEKETREIDVASKCEAFFAQNAAGYKGFRYGKAWVQISSGEKTAKEAWFAGIVSEAKKLQTGEFVMLEMGCVADGYWCDLTRTAVVDGPSEKQQKILDLVLNAQQEAIKEIKPGVVVEVAYNRAMEVIVQEGYGEYFIHGLGHGLGFSYHEPIPGIGPGSTMKFKKGMCSSVEPGVYIKGFGGVRWETNIVVTDKGARELGKK